MKKHTSRTGEVLTACLVVFLAAGVVTSQAVVSGTLYKRDGGQASGTIKFMPSSKTYYVTANNATIPVMESQIIRVNIVKPATLDGAIRMVGQKQYKNAVPILEAIVQEYKNLQWDDVALGYLGECYLNTGQTDKAIGIVKKAIQQNPEGLTIQTLQIYWAALLKDKKLDELEKSLEPVISGGSREAAAAAQIKKGDLLKERGKLREAVVDGYMRTVMLYDEVKEIRAEAVYKAMKACEELGQQSYAEKMRKILLTEFPNDPYTAKIKVGT
jgi:tetratricopeptide (TPR) repeat protein